MTAGPGEDQRAALVREPREETAVAAADVDDEPVLRIEDGEPSLTVRAVRAWDGEPRDLQPEEHDGLRWVTAAELRGPAPADPSSAGLVERVARPGVPPD